MEQSKFEHDVFISYAHIDNQPLSEGQRGWIAMFHDALLTRLAMLMGENPKIWRDKKLGGNDRFDNEIIDHLVRAATLIAVLSPRYVQSEWCIRELEKFRETAQNNDGIDVGNQSRLFKVVKTPIDWDKEPDIARGLLGYPFYKQDPETGRWREFDRAFGKDLEPEFWRVLDDLAQDISKLLALLGSDKPVTAPTSGATVYLAETTSDLQDDRDRIRRELEDHGHEIVPDRPLPLTGDVEDVINGYLDRADLSIHLIGAFYSIVPEGYEHSLLEIQNECATRHSQAGKLSRIVWMPPELELKDERQKKFVDALNDDPQLNPRDSVLEGTLDTLKTEIHDRLRPEPLVAAAGSELKRLYFIYDECDEDAMQSVNDYLYDQDVEIIEPLFSQNEDQARRDHEEKLRLADAVFVFWGDADDAWLNKIRLDLAKIPSPSRVSAIYMAGPETKTKKRFRSKEIDEVIRNFGDFEPESLKPFLAKLLPEKEA